MIVVRFKNSKSHKEHLMNASAMVGIITIISKLKLFPKIDKMVLGDNKIYAYTIEEQNE